MKNLLQIAIENRAKEIILFLIEQNPLSINRELPNGHTPLSYATNYGYYSMILFLIDNGADIFSRDVSGNCYIYNLLCYSRSILEDDYPMIDEIIRTIILKQKIDVNMKLANGKTLLHAASTGCNCRVVKFFLEKGADVNAKDNKGETPLFAAFDFYKKRCKDFTSDYFAHNNECTVEILLENGAKNLKNNNGETIIEFIDTQIDKFNESILELTLKLRNNEYLRNKVLIELQEDKLNKRSLKYIRRSILLKT